MRVGRDKYGNVKSSVFLIPRILFVDDMQVILDLYEASLSDVYRVTAVSSGTEAIDCVRRNPDIDVAVVDYKLPDLSGIDVMKEIKEIRPSIPVIIVTGYGDEETAVEAFRSGARDYLKKPINMSELCAKIDFFLALRNADNHSRKNVLFDRSLRKTSSNLQDAVSFKQRHRVQQAVRFINDNYRNNLRLDDAAGIAGMSPPHFSRIFKKVMGGALPGLSQ